MMILDLGICLELDLEVPRVIRLYLPKVGNLYVWRVHRFDRGLTLIISKLDCCFGTWYRFVMLFGTCVQNLVGIRIS